MNYEQVDIALGFLGDDTEYIVLQVPYARDVVLVMDYLTSKHRDIIECCTPNSIKFINGERVFIESFVGNDQSGVGVGSGKCFMIDRMYDRLYMVRLEVVG